MEQKILTIVGMGPGISMAVAERFAQEGYLIAMIARNAGRLGLFQEILQHKGYTCISVAADAGKPEELHDAFDKIRRQLGHTDVLVYNVAKMKKLDILQDTAESISEDLMVNVGGALESVKAVLPPMKTRGFGTIILTGGGYSLYPSPLFGSLSIGKAGLRSLAAQLHQALADTEIKVATVTVAGTVDKESATHKPEAIAEMYWQLHNKPKAEIPFETVF
jgi:short-subunit dehydrogenase